MNESFEEQDAVKFRGLIFSVLAIVIITLGSVAVFAQTQDETPVELDSLASQRGASLEREWRRPDFSGQTNAMGWTPETFAVPAGMEKQVQFWVDIYTKYTTHQGVIHDSESPDLVYEVVDFAEIEKSTLPERAKNKMKRQMVEDAKKRVARTLEKLDPMAKAFDTDRLRFQLGQKDRMEQAIFLSGRYLEDFEKVFQEAGLPKELTRLVFVESSFNVLARSKVGASGLWQLMPGTVRPMRIMNASVDGRNHPLTATRAAARILTTNFKMLGSWPLALTGYNHGPSGVSRLSQKYNTRNIADLIRDVKGSASFGFASRNFYASFLAALLVEKNASVHFPNIKWSKTFDAEEFRLPQQIKYADLLNWFGKNDERLQLMNPHLTVRVRRGYSIPAGTTVAVPSEKYSQALLSLGHRLHGVAGLAAAAASPARAVASESQGEVLHRVSRGENLWSISREYNVPFGKLLKANDFNGQQKVVPGMKIRIPQ